MGAASEQKDVYYTYQKRIQSKEENWRQAVLLKHRSLKDCIQVAAQITFSKYNVHLYAFLLKSTYIYTPMVFK